MLVNFLEEEYILHTVCDVIIEAVIPPCEYVHLKLTTIAKSLGDGVQFEVLELGLATVFPYPLKASPTSQRGRCVEAKSTANRLCCVVISSVPLRWSEHSSEWT